MGPTTDPGGGAEPVEPADLNLALEAAFAAYVAALEASAGEDAGLLAAYTAYAGEVALVFRDPAVAGRSWELGVRYFRSLQGDSAPAGMAEPGRYSRMVEAALDMTQGQQKVLATYQALVTAVLGAADGLDGDAVASASAAYAGAVRDAWCGADPAALAPVDLLAASQSVLAATSLQGLLVEARRDAGEGGA